MIESHPELSYYCVVNFLIFYSHGMLFGLFYNVQFCIPYKHAYLHHSPVNYLRLATECVSISAFLLLLPLIDLRTCKAHWQRNRV